MGAKINLTKRTKDALREALDLSVKNRSEYASSCHILRAILEQQDGIAINVLSAAGVDYREIARKNDSIISNIPISSHPSKKMDEEALNALNASQKLSHELGDEYISTEVLLAGIAKSNSEVSKMMKSSGADYKTIISTFEKVRGVEKIHSAESEGKTTALDKYSVDMTQLARDGKIDPVIGRDAETRRVIQILSRRSKNNPIIVGEPGTGKTALVEGLARRMVSGDIPETLKGKRLISLDMSSMLAGATLRGQFEERLKDVLAEIKEASGNIITFIDEVHTIVGAGGEGAGDAANMIKPMLARGELKLIGATTLDEYRLYIEQDPALVRRFQRIVVNEPEIPDALAIMRGIKSKYEAHHGIRISDSALVSAVELSARYVPDRFLPDKAIDLIDESASRLRMDIDSSPEEIDELERNVRRMEVEREALKRETDGESKQRLSELEKDISEEREQLTLLRSQWASEKTSLDDIRLMKQELEKLHNESERLQREGEYTEASNIQYIKIPELEGKIHQAEELAQSSGSNRAMAMEEVTPDVVADVVSTWTGIPAGKMLHGESKRLQDMESTLSERVIGQPQAVSSVSKAVKRSRAGVSDPDRPIGSFLFLGPSGTGKAIDDEEPIFVTNKEGSHITKKKHGELKVGDYVFDRNGFPTAVLGVYPQGRTKAMKVSFDDGRSVICNPEHLWLVDIGGYQAVRTTSWIVDEKMIGFVRIPYGEGLHFGKENNDTMYFYGYKSIKNKTNVDFSHLSLRDRKNIVSGILLSGGRMVQGYIKVDCHKESYAYNLVDLFSSIGLVSEIVDRTTLRVKGDYATALGETRRRKPYIVSIEELSQEKSMTCIMVDNEEHLYQLANGVVTHNTELAKTVADFIFDDEKAMIRIDMSEFADKHSAARLVGAPPGYVGYEQGGQLTEAVRRKPYTVVLFDEVEKAHPDIFDILLQVLDEGRLTDGQSKLIDFKNTILILTSNLGAGANAKEGDMIKAAKKHFKPEFINRLDSMVEFNSLTKEQISGIVEIQVAKLAQRVFNSQRMTLSLDASARDFLSEKGYDPAYGARPVKRAIQDYVEDMISDNIIDGNISEGDNIDIVYNSETESLSISGTMKDDLSKILEDLDES